MLLALGRRPIFVSRFLIRLSHELVKPAQTSSQKVHKARVNTLLFGADRLLLTPRADTLESYFMTKLSDAQFYNTYRSVAFMRAIRFCLERHLFGIALALHDRMLGEGFLTTLALSLRMAALGLARNAMNSKDTVAPLKKLFEQQAYDVPAFMDLVHYLADDKHAPGALVDELAHAFVSIRQIKLSEYPDLVGLLARVNLRTDRLDAAQSWLQIFEDACGTQGVLPDVVPYSDIINTLNDIDPTNGDAIQDMLMRMKVAGVSPDTSVFNALIRVNLVQKRYQEAFALYHIFFEKRSVGLMPNDVTYKMLFRAASLLSHPRLAQSHRYPGNAVPPRRLFRDMLTCHLEQTKGELLERSTVVSVSAFHLALRTFMAREDYTAVFIAIHALHAFGFHSNLQTYLIVFVNLLHRMKHETTSPRPQGSYCLVDFLTHVRPDEDPDLQTLLHRIRHPQPAVGPSGSSAIGIDTVSHLLGLGDSTRPTTDDLPDVPTLPPISSFSRPYQQHTQMPTVEMLTGAQEADSNQRIFFSPVPLARIVHKVLLGELFRKAVHRRADWDWKGAVLPIVEDTARDMIPENTIMRGKAGGRRQGGDVLPFAAARMRRRRQGARGRREVALDLES